MNLEAIIIEAYTNGTSIAQLLRDYPTLTRGQINKILAKNNIPVRGGRKKKELTIDQIEYIKKRISEGAFTKEIAQELNMTVDTVAARMEDLGIKNPNKNRVNRRIKSDYFSTIDCPEKAYWLGFLFTDGCVDCYKGTGRIRLQLQEADLEILEKFKEDLQIDSKIIYDRRYNSTCCSVEFVDAQIYNDLQRYDIKPRKTYEVDHIPYEKIPQEYLNAFALGLFDGDGCLTCSENCSTDVTFGYTAYHETEVKDFRDLICLLDPNAHKVKTVFTSAWHVNWRGRLQVISIMDQLYKNCPRFLKRKHDKYLALKNSLN